MRKFYLIEYLDKDGKSKGFVQRDKHSSYKVTYGLVEAEEATWYTTRSAASNSATPAAFYLAQRRNESVSAQDVRRFRRMRIKIHEISVLAVPSTGLLNQALKTIEQQTAGGG